MVSYTKSSALRGIFFICVSIGIILLFSCFCAPSAFAQGSAQTKTTAKTSAPTSCDEKILGTASNSNADGGAPNDGDELDKESNKEQETQTPKTEAEKMDELAAQNKISANKYSDGLVKNASYLIQMSASENKVLDVNGKSTKSGANVTTWSSNMGKNQRWKVLRDDKGYVTFINVNSNKALAIASSSPASGTNVCQKTLNANARSQKWLLVENGGAWRLLSALGNGLSLHVAGASLKDGANVCVKVKSASAAQRFNFIRYGVANAAPQEAVKSIDPAAWYEVSTSSGGKIVADVAGNGIKDGDGICLWKNNTGLNQIFSFTFVKTKGKLGYYRITAANSGKVLKLSGNNLVATTGIVIGKKASNYGQYWTITENKGTYTITSALSALYMSASSKKSGATVQTSASPFKFNLNRRADLLANGIYSIRAASNANQCIDVSGASRGNNAPALMWTYGGAFNQKWYIAADKDHENTYILESINSGKRLAAAAAKEGSAIVQKSAGASKLQRWMPAIVSGAIIFANCKNPSLRLDMAQGRTANGTALHLWNANASKAQRFKLQEENVLEQGHYFVASKNNSKSVWGVTGASKANGARVSMWNKNPEGKQGEQKWEITVTTSGNICLLNAYTQKRLDIDKGIAKSGAYIVQGKATSAKRQIFTPVYVPGSGAIQIASALDTSYVVDATPSGSSIPLRLKKSSGASTQLFHFEKTEYNPFSPAELAMMAHAQGFRSPTSYLVLTDLSRRTTGVFRGSKGNWGLVRFESCATGSPGHETITGTYSLGYHQYNLAKWPDALYCTHIYGEYFYHSILDSRDELGKNISHGCIRLDWDYAKYIQTLPTGSTVSWYW